MIKTSAGSSNINSVDLESK